jgi:chemotaxis protein histidine kinase CheA/ActR/RegA family two-component response regulator
MIDPELLAVFLPEAHGYLARLPDPDAAHGLKGACSMVGLDELAAHAAALEKELRAGRDGREQRRNIEARLRALETGSTPSQPEWDPDELRGLRAFFLDEAVEHLEAISEAITDLRAHPDAAAPLQSLLRKLHTLKGSAGSVLLDDLARLAHRLEDRLVALRDRGSGVGAEDLRFLDENLVSLSSEIAKTTREVRGVPQPAEPRAIGEERPDAPTVRVEVERIDELMDAASELVFDRSRIARRMQELEGCARDLAKVRGALQHVLLEIERVPNDLGTRFSEIATELTDVLASFNRAGAGAAEDAEGLARTSATLQEGIRRVRMMSVGRLFARLVQPIRELARKEGKEVEIRTAGEETEIDKAVVERVYEPLLHLSRNAIAHGIEPPDERRRAGKPPGGAITLSARHEGDVTEIMVADDGHGIDLEAVRRALVMARRVSADAAGTLDEEALYAALFEPGFSTRDGADDLAGRGVGLDAVRDAILRLGGQVRVSSKPGRGASFIVRLPLTTAVQQALLFKVGGQVYAVPAARVQEAVQVAPEDLRLGPAEERVLVRGRELPLVRLGALLGVPAPPGLATRSGLVLTAESETFLITCDKVIGPREIVVRSLGPLLAGLPLYAGATISGAGKVQLILDVEHLLRQAKAGVRGVRPTRALGPRRVLIVDDSRSIRETASLILAQGGYAVEAVPDGWDAWELLQDRPFDVLVTDLEMPRLDGHELIGRVRRSSELKQLPVVVVSSRTADAIRARVLQSGADGFVPKPLRRKLLLDAVDAALRQSVATGGVRDQ